MLDIAFGVICFIVFAIGTFILFKAVYNCGKADGIKIGVELCVQEEENEEPMMPERMYVIPMEHEHGE